jgi:hypothetical protein
MRGLTECGPVCSTRRIIPCADDGSTLGLVAEDVDLIWGELVMQTATVIWRVPSARREVAEVAATMDERARCAALLSAKGTGQ